MGGLFFFIAGKVTIPSQVTHFVQLPHIFAWGLPKWNTGMAVSSFVMVCILVSNTVAAIIAINQATIHKATIEQKTVERWNMGWGDFAYHLFCIFNCRCRSVTSNGRIYTFNKTKIYPIVLNGMCVTSRNVSFSKYYSLLSIFTISCRIGCFNGFVRTVNWN